MKLFYDCACSIFKYKGDSFEVYFSKRLQVRGLQPNQKSSLLSTFIGFCLDLKFFDISQYFTKVYFQEQIMENKERSMNELKNAFYSLKSIKNPGCVDIRYNVIKEWFDSLCQPLKYIFNLSIQKDVFLDNSKIAGITPIYKGEDSCDVNSLECQINVLLSFQFLNFGLLSLIYYS